MTIAAVFLLGWLLPHHAGDLGPASSSADVLSPTLPCTAPTLGDVPPSRKPGRDDPSSFLVEEEDEDDNVDEAPLGWAHGLGCGAVPGMPAGRLSGRVPVRVASRSAAPTLRLRC